MLSAQQVRGVDWLRTSCVTPHRQLRCVKRREVTAALYTAIAYRLLFHRARSTCSAGWHHFLFVSQLHVSQTQTKLLSQISHPVLAWEQADATRLDNLYRIGQQADHLVQQQLDGDLLPCKHRCLDHA